MGACPVGSSARRGSARRPGSSAGGVLVGSAGCRGSAGCLPRAASGRQRSVRRPRSGAGGCSPAGPGGGSRPAAGASSPGRGERRVGREGSLSGGSAAGSSVRRPCAANQSNSSGGRSPGAAAGSSSSCGTFSGVPGDAVREGRSTRPGNLAPGAPAAGGGAVPGRGRAGRSPAAAGGDGVPGRGRAGRSPAPGGDGVPGRGRAGRSPAAGGWGAVPARGPAGGPLTAGGGVGAAGRGRTGRSPAGGGAVAPAWWRPEKTPPRRPSARGGTTSSRSRSSSWKGRYSTRQALSPSKDRSRSPGTSSTTTRPVNHSRIDRYAPLRRSAGRSSTSVSAAGSSSPGRPSGDSNCSTRSSVGSRPRSATVRPASRVKSTIRLGIRQPVQQRPEGLRVTDHLAPTGRCAHRHGPGWRGPRRHQLHGGWADAAAECRRAGTASPSVVRWLAAGAGSLGEARTGVAAPSTAT